MRPFILALALAWAPNVFGQPTAEDLFGLLAESAKPLNQEDINTLLTTRYRAHEIQAFHTKYLYGGPKDLTSPQVDILITYLKFITACQELHDHGELQDMLARMDARLKKGKSPLSDKAAALEKKWLQRMKNYPKAKVIKILPDRLVKRISNSIGLARAP